MRLQVSIINQIQSINQSMLVELGEKTLLQSILLHTLFLFYIREKYSMWNAINHAWVDINWHSVPSQWLKDGYYKIGRKEAHQPASNGWMALSNEWHIRVSYNWTYLRPSGDHSLKKNVQSHMNYVGNIYGKFLVAYIFIFLFNLCVFFLFSFHTFIPAAKMLSVCWKWNLLILPYLHHSHQ